jgi:phage terminase large subunit-like protein
MPDGAESLLLDWNFGPPDPAALMAEGIDSACRPLETAVESIAVDPLVRLLDPDFRDVLWEYEGSRIEPEVPGNLHPKQMEALQAEAKHRWLFWGNQVGKTTCGAIDLVLLALGRHPYLQRWKPPINAWASALTWELWQDILLPEILTWIPDDRIIDAPEPYRQSTKRSILVRADNGKISRITGKAAQQGASRYQSKRLHAFWGDEEHPEEIYDELMPRLLRHGGVTIWTMTPLKGLTWVYHRIYEPHKHGKYAKSEHYVSHAGLVDNPSIKPEEIEALKRELRHNPAQLEARLHGHFVRPQGLVLPFDFDKMGETLDERSLQVLRDKATIFAGVDFGLWRFALVVFMVDRAGRVHLVEEMFSQREDLDTRAKRLHDLLQRLGASRGTTIAGDCANPQDIVEINRCLQRIESPYHVSAVKAENKIRKVGVERIENLMNRGAFLVRRGIGTGTVWYLGMNASRQGKPVEGSRWVWEANNWLYPKTEEGKIQKDDPDDASADGGDMMAATRYAIMTWWSAAALPEEKPVDPWDPTVIRAEEEWMKYDRPAPVAAGHRVGRRVGGGNPMNGV